jgi:hypothetical protein
MFFANLVNNVPPEDCPDNDGHNVDTIDGLVLPTIVSLAEAARGSSVEATAQQAAACARVTRNSPILERSAAAWSRLVYGVLNDDDALSKTEQLALNTARSLGLRKPQPRDAMTACYLDSAMPALLDGVVKYAGSSSVWDALLVNANTGGENVHRGSCLGAVLGASLPADKTLEPRLQQGLYNHRELQNEIDDFVKAVLKD